MFLCLTSFSLSPVIHLLSDSFSLCIICCKGKVALFLPINKIDFMRVMLKTKIMFIIIICCFRCKNRLWLQCHQFVYRSLSFSVLMSYSLTIYGSCHLCLVMKRCMTKQTFISCFKREVYESQFLSVCTRFLLLRGTFFFMFKLLKRNKEKSILSSLVWKVED